MAAALEDDSDPTFTHFVHKHDFHLLLIAFLGADWREKPSEKENENEDRLVAGLGAIVSVFGRPSDARDAELMCSSTTTCHCRVCSIQRWMRLYLL